ncbi:phenylalanine ammonia-lyase [Pisolithus croceorrhizus]|nr:phenylalanine ammonia-lyase [Pisolithus croceorrhizus]
MASFITQYIADVHELDGYLAGKPIVLDGSSLSLPQIAAIALYPPLAAVLTCAPSVELSSTQDVRAKVAASRAVIDTKVAAGLSIYGVSTGFGGSADTRTDDPLALGAALLQHQHAGVILPSTASPPSHLVGPMPLTDPTHGTTMPAPWTRAAMLVRANSLIRGHSGVRWTLVEKIVECIRKGLVPVVPLRGSISASGDLSSLSYVAGMLIGNPAIRVWMSAPRALRATGTAPLPLVSKEHLGILNGTAFSAGLASLVVRNTETIGVLGAALTALAVEALNGAHGSFDPFVGEARPHVGQIEAAHLIYELLAGSQFAVNHEAEVKIEEDDGVLRQDRYSLRTAPQWLGPQFEELKHAKETVRVEVNSTTDNPLVEPPKTEGADGIIHHAGNFQALAMTVAMDHLRLALAQIGRLMFVQLTEILNPLMNRGLPGNLAGGEAALDFGGKGLDIAAAAYAGELNALGGMNVGVGVVSAEMHNQSLNSLALVSARYTLTALEVSELLAASHIYILCQAVDLRAVRTEMHARTGAVVRSALSEAFANAFITSEALDIATRKVTPKILDELDQTTSVALGLRMARVASAGVAPLLEVLTSDPSCCTSTLDLAQIARFKQVLAQRLEALLTELRCAFIIPPMGRAPASKYLAPRTRLLYEFVRLDLGISMHGSDNLRKTVYGMRARDQEAQQSWDAAMLEEAGLGRYDRGGTPGWEDCSGGGKDVRGDRRMNLDPTMANVR